MRYTKPHHPLNGGVLFGFQSLYLLRLSSQCLNSAKTIPTTIGAINVEYNKITRIHPPSAIVSLKRKASTFSVSEIKLKSCIFLQKKTCEKDTSTLHCKGSR